MGHKRTQTSRIAHPRYMGFFALLMAGFAALAAFLPIEMALIGGFDIAAGAFALSLLPAWLNSTPDTIRKTAARDDGGRQILLTLTAIIVTVVTISVGVLVADKDALSASRIACRFFGEKHLFERARRHAGTWQQRTKARSQVDGQRGGSVRRGTSPM